MDKILEARPRGEDPTGHTTSFESHDRGTHTPRRPTTADDPILADLAEVEGRLSERDDVWKGLVRRLDALRREVAVANAQAQMSRSLAAHDTPEYDDAGQEGRTPSPTPDEARAVRLTQEFEAALLETEQQRVRLHDEMDDLRRRRQALLGRLPSPCLVPTT